MSEILRLLAPKILSKHLQIVGEIGRYLLLSSFSNVANGLDKLLIGAFDVPGVRIVNLETHILNWVLLPELVLVLGKHKQGKSQLEQNILNVFFANSARLFLGQCHRHEFKGTVQRFGTHKLVFAAEENL